MLDLKQILGIGAITLASALGIEYLISDSTRKPREDYSNSLGEFPSNVEAYQGLIQNKKTGAWESPQASIRSYIDLSTPPITNTAPAQKTLEQRKNLKPNLFESPKSKKPGTLQDYLLENVAKENFTEIVTPEFVCKVIAKESRWNPNARGTSGERGLMQILPRTWDEQTKKLYGKKWGFEWAYSPVVNVEVGTAYLKDINKFFSKEMLGYNSFSRNEKQGLIGAGYNCGPTTIVKLNGKLAKVPRSTREYVRALNVNEG